MNSYEARSFIEFFRLEDVDGDTDTRDSSIRLKLSLVIYNRADGNTVPFNINIGRLGMNHSWLLLLLLDR